MCTLKPTKSQLIQVKSFFFFQYKKVCRSRSNLALHSWFNGESLVQDYGRNRVKIKSGFSIMRDTICRHILASDPVLELLILRRSFPAETLTTEFNRKFFSIAVKDSTKASMKALISLHVGKYHCGFKSNDSFKKNEKNDESVN